MKRYPSLLITFSCFVMASGCGQSAGESANDADAGASPDNATMVPIPTYLSVMPGCAAAWVNWTAPTMPTGTTLTGYSVKRAATSAGPWTDVSTCSTTSRANVESDVYGPKAQRAVTGCPALSLTQGATYTFRVAAITKSSTGVISTGSWGFVTSTAIHTINSNCDTWDIGPGGGELTYASTTAFACGTTLTSQCHYLEVSPKLGKTTWCNNTVSNVPGATGYTFGTGARNTLAMLTANGSFTGCTAGAATLASSYRGGGLSDWFLPSQYDLRTVKNTVYDSLGTPLAPQFITAVASGSWWSSTQGSFAPTAYAVTASGAIATDVSKAYSYEVHAMRAF